MHIVSLFRKTEVGALHRCPLTADQIGISIKSCPLMAESWKFSVES
jgi:hypothetical protein